MNLSLLYNLTDFINFLLNLLHLTREYVKYKDYGICGYKNRREAI